MNILVTYATRCGSTQEVAGQIGGVLRTSATVTVLPIDAVHDLAPYDAVIIGSAIRGAQPLPEVTEFVDRFEGELREMPTALFVTTLTLMENTPDNRITVRSYIEPLMAQINPMSVGLFAGALRYSQLTFPLRLMMRTVGAQGGDYRDWAAIRAWAYRLHEMLIAVPA